MPVSLILSLCLFKLLSWSISLGSGTSGGTLAPLLTIGGAIGALAGHAIEGVFPGLAINLPLAALVGMSALFAGASRAVLTSIVFALETTHQTNSLLPLLAACAGSYSISFLLMENTIMTEKIARRGTKTPESYESDWLEKWTVGEVATRSEVFLADTSTLPEVYQYLRQTTTKCQRFVVLDTDHHFRGIVSLSALITYPDQTAPLHVVMAAKQYPSISPTSSLKDAIELMTRKQVDMLTVVSADESTIRILDYTNLFSAYQTGLREYTHREKHISVRKSLSKRFAYAKKGKQTPWKSGALSGNE
ncbi:chloride channel protein [Spirosoma telluris]|uniref:chloride channel protein n=1 Tax=Spirosoma telluris TaxID=2183553 RepID=UPI002FC3287D